MAMESSQTLGAADFKARCLGILDLLAARAEVQLAQLPLRGCDGIGTKSTPTGV